MYHPETSEDPRMPYALELLAKENIIVVFVENTTTTYWHMLYIKLKMLLNHFEWVK